jgi:hypothetical protein
MFPPAGGLLSASCGFALPSGEATFYFRRPFLQCPAEKSPLLTQPFQPPRISLLRSMRDAPDIVMSALLPLRETHG